METQKIGYDYFQTMGMEMVEGRSFSPEFPTDSISGFILNEQALKLSQIKDPIGKTFGLYGQEGVIIGIVKNTLFKSAERDINPQVYHFLKNPAREAYFCRANHRSHGNLYGRWSKCSRGSGSRPNRRLAGSCCWSRNT